MFFDIFLQIILKVIAHIFLFAGIYLQQYFIVSVKQRNITNASPIHKTNMIVWDVKYGVKSFGKQAVLCYLIINISLCCEGWDYIR